MALKNRKGFVYTLEAILASLMVLGVAVSVLPGFQNTEESVGNPEQQVYSGLQTLDRSGNLSGKSVSEVETLIEPYIPESYEYSVQFVEVNRLENDVSAPYETYISEEGNYSEIQLWIDSASDLGISFNETDVLEDYSGSGYEEISLTEPEGWLNFTGTGDIEYSLNIYQTTEDNVDEEDVSIAQYVVTENGFKEIRVKLWR